MATTKVLGKVSLTLGGDYSDAVSYSRLTMVLAADGKGYVSKQDNTVGIEPAVTAGWENYWQLVTERGAGVTSIQKTASGETSDTYTIYYENGTTSTYQAENGKGYVADVTRSLGDDFSIMTGAYSVIDGAGWTNGKYLKNNGDISNVADMKVMALTAVPEGSYTLAIRATSPFASQAMRFCGYDGSGTFVRGLGNFAAPTAAGVLKATINTTGCAQIRIAAGLYDAVAVYAGESIIEKVSAIDATLIDKAPAIMNTTESAPIATFPDGAAGLPMALTVGIEPVQAGSGDPSPTNVRPITGWTGCNVVRTGKNLLNAADATAQKYIRPNGEITGAPGWSASAFIPIKGGATYVLSGVTNTGTSAYHAFYDAGKTFISAVVSTTYVLNAPAGAAFIRVSMKTETPTGVQLETGSTPTAFSPYAGSTTLPVAFPSSAGTVYGGTLRIERDGSGTLTVDRAMVDLGTLSWSIASGSLTSLFNAIGLPHDWSTDTPVCEQYKGFGAAASSNAANSNGNGSCCFLATGNKRLYVRDDRFTDAASFATAVSGVKLVYTLATPSTYTLTPGQVLSILGDNRVWADCGSTSVEYAADTKLFIETRIAELQALVLENIGG